MHYLAQRRDRLAAHVRQQGLDGFLVTNPVSVTYLTGFTGDSSYVYVGRDRVLLLTDGRYTGQIADECPDLPLHVRPPQQRLMPAAIEVLGKLRWANVGCESGHLTVADFETFRTNLPAVSWKPEADAVEMLRVRKDPSEVQAIRDAIGIAARAFTRFRAALRPDDTEWRLHHRMEMLLREEGARCSSFPTIAAVGPRSALPHAPPTERTVGDAELVLVDWGARGPLYVSDLTRVLAIRRKKTPRLAPVYEAVLKAQQRAIAAVRPGVPAEAVDAAARGALAEAGLGEYFTHGLGHGLGLEVHEAPAVRPNTPAPLEAGMVITIEPGVYLPDWGGVRIEDDVLVTPDGAEVLSPGVPRELDEMLIAF